MSLLIGIDLGTTLIKSIVPEADSGASWPPPSAAGDPAAPARLGGAKSAAWWAATVDRPRGRGRLRRGPGPDRRDRPVRPDARDGPAGRGRGSLAPGHHLGRYAWHAQGGRPAPRRSRGLAAIAPGPPGGGLHGADSDAAGRARPGLLGRRAAAVLPKDPLRDTLSGAYPHEPSDAAATWLFDVAAGDWSEDRSTCAGWSAVFCRRGGFGGRSRGADARRPERWASQAGNFRRARRGGPARPGARLRPARTGHGPAHGRTGGQASTPGPCPGSILLLPYHVSDHAAAGALVRRGPTRLLGWPCAGRRDVLAAGDSGQLSALAEAVRLVPEGLAFLPDPGREADPHLDPGRELASCACASTTALAYLGLVLLWKGVSLRRWPICLEPAAADVEQIIRSGGVSESPGGGQTRRTRWWCCRWSWGRVRMTLTSAWWWWAELGGGRC